MAKVYRRPRIKIATSDREAGVTDEKIAIDFVAGAYTKRELVGSGNGGCNGGHRRVTFACQISPCGRTSGGLVAEGCLCAPKGRCTSKTANGEKIRIRKTRRRRWWQRRHVAERKRVPCDVVGRADRGNRRGTTWNSRRGWARARTRRNYILTASFVRSGRDY